jgi:predicted transcriptional regulator
VETIPVIDPRVKHIGVSKLRGLSADSLKEKTTTDTFVIQENDTPLAVLLSYEKFLIIQEQMQAVMNTMELLCEESEVAGVKAGLDDLKAGRVRSLVDIRNDLARSRKTHG